MSLSRRVLISVIVLLALGCLFIACALGLVPYLVKYKLDTVGCMNIITVLFLVCLGNEASCHMSVVTGQGLAFDVVSHEVPLQKVSTLDLPDNIHNWLVSFIIGHQQKCKVSGSSSSCNAIMCGIIQGSGVGPTFYIIMRVI